MDRLGKRSNVTGETKYSMITPGVSNSNVISLGKAVNNGSKNDLKKLASKTPSKTPLQLSAKKKTPMHNSIMSDRYIPARTSTNMEASYHLLHANSLISNMSRGDLGEAAGGAENEYLVDSIKRKLIIDTCNGIQEKSKILHLHNKPIDHEHSFSDNMKILYNGNTSIKKQSNRYIPSSPDRILDAPDFRDDYYLNLIDWSNTNFLAVALNKDMYIWNSSNGEISQLFSMEENTPDYICSAAWIQNKSNNILAVGNSKNLVELWDVNKMTCVRRMASHRSRVGCLAWNQHILSSGSRSGEIHNHDVRVAQHHVGSYKQHEQEVCGLKWSPDGRYLASGANDNNVCVWDRSMSHEAQPLHVLRGHTAAVKAVAWCPWQHNVLATGGGALDKHIKIWNTHNGNVLCNQDAKSQISCILWSRHYKELITSHGLDQNQLTIWKYPEMTRICDLTGHTNRILLMVMSPDEEVVASVSADETIRLWKCFPLDEKQKRCKDSSLIGDKLSSSQTSLSSCIR